METTIILPFEIISIILDFCSFNSRIKFFSTCKEYRDFTNFSNVKNAKNDPSLYKGYVYTICCKLSFVFDDLHSFSGIRELVLNTTQNISGLLHFELNLPSLKKLELISPIRFFLKKLKMPILTHLDITQCQKCVLDNCNFPSLTNLYVCEELEIPLRFCKIPMNASVFEMYKKEIVSCTIFFLYVFREKIVAQETQFNYWGKYIFTDETCCDNCPFLCDVINKDTLYCRTCNFTRNLTPIERDTYETAAHCRKCHFTSKPLFIFINKAGFGVYYCCECRKYDILSKLRMCAIGKINGTRKYPLIY